MRAIAPLFSSYRAKLAAYPTGILEKLQYCYRNLIESIKNGNELFTISTLNTKEKMK